MSNFLVFADAEAVISKALRDADITGINSRWYSSVPKTPTYALGVVRRVGGLPAVRRVLDRPNIQIDVWGNTKSEAHDISQEARVAILELEGTTVIAEDGRGDDAFISGVDDSLGLLWLPDPDTSRDRYTFGVYVSIRPVLSGS